MGGTLQFDVLPISAKGRRLEEWEDTFNLMFLPF